MALSVHTARRGWATAADVLNTRPLRTILDVRRAARAWVSAVTFDVAADAYDRLMGRYSASLSPQLADLARVQAGHAGARRRLRAGRARPRSWSRAWARRAWPRRSRREPFGGPPSSGRPGVEVAPAAAEELPFAEDAFDASLVAAGRVNFMSDPAAGVPGFERVTRAGGVVAACVWDYAGGTSPLARLLARGGGARPRRARRVRAAGGARGRARVSLRGGGARRRGRRRALGARRARALRDWWGSRSPWASDRRGPTWRDSTPRAPPSCANGAACSWATGR